MVDPGEFCPFCRAAGAEQLYANELAYALRDRFPVSPGHTLVVPRRHVATWFEATPEERQAMFALVDAVRAELDAKTRPDGYNVGFNVGAAAGQTVMHLQVHVIPRYDGDVDDRTGGVRLVIPSKANYLRSGDVRLAGSWERPLSTGTVADRFNDHVTPLFASAKSAAILTAFVQDSGIYEIETALRSALDRGCRLRLLTGDYLNITQARAPGHLLDIVRGSAAVGQDAGETTRALQVRVVEVASLVGLARSFHPKAWIFTGRGFGTAFVGSSNLSQTALTDGVEWNLRLDRHRDPEGFAAVVGAFEAWWNRGRELDEEWLVGYAQRARTEDRPPPTGELSVEILPPPEPHPVQRDALAALRRDREAGRKRALVVMATGLGKTWLASFDVAAVAREAGTMPRVLVLAHRVELLDQAAATFRRQFRDARFGWMVGSRTDLEGDIVFASVMKLGRPERLSKVQPEAFDYVVVDEVHHADAPTWRRILTHLRPHFLLGLTATPERADDGDIVGLFDDHVAYEAGIGLGIELGRLVPVHYFGLKDVVDYAPIPWRNRRFDPVEVARAVQSEARMERLWSAWAEHAAARTLVFCFTIAHARFVGDWLSGRGVRVAVVHSEPSSDDRARSLARLASGELDAVCAVDLFNEGVDIPSVDRVVMLRPTESPVLFLQQLGRGLRSDSATGKEALTVIDFVGNHRVFLDRVQTLVSLGAGGVSVRDFIERGKAPEVPPGCTVHVEVEAIDMLRRLLPAGARLALVLAYRDLREARGRRPSLGEVYRRGLNPRSLKGFDGWFEFVRSEGDLGEAEQVAFAERHDWLLAVEVRETLNKSFKMVALQALLDLDGMHTGASVAAIADSSYAILSRSPELMADLDGSDELPDPAHVSPEAWRAYWERWPLRHWVGDGKHAKSQPWFRLANGRFEPRFSVTPKARDALAEMTRELIDYRLAQYRRRSREATAAKGQVFECKLFHDTAGAILKLPDRARDPNLPEGDTDVRLPDGSAWRFRFAKIACNVAHPVGSARNQLPDLLRRWFGPAAGAPGTDFHVGFRPTPDGWWIEPVEHEKVVALPVRGRLVAYPSVQAAAGWSGGAQHAEGIEPDKVALPGDFDREQCFALRACGTSMDGWSSEIRDGDWVVLRWARGLGLRALEARIALVARGDPHVGRSYHLKRVVRVGDRIELRSDNPAVPAMPAEDDDEPLAVVAATIRPETLAPREGTVLGADELAEAFGASEAPSAPWSRVDGHLFILIDAKGLFVAADRIRAPFPNRRPGETAYVLVVNEAAGGWRYLGVGRWSDVEVAWRVPELDFHSWRALGDGRTASRRLEEEWLDAARVRASALEAVRGATLSVLGTRCRILDRAQHGGVRIDGGEGGFQPRTVSLVDLGWALKARTHAQAQGGVADESLVNRLRYLDGTPRGSTRWIDTTWALVLTEVSSENLRD